MKNVFIFACLCLAFGTAFAENVDSVIVNIGSRKKIILYGQNKQDLKDLEKYDLNKVTKQMNKELENASVNRKKIVIKDYTGTTYTKDSNLTNLNKWQRITKNSKINFWISATPDIIKGGSGYENDNISIPRSSIWKTTGMNIGVSFLHSKNYRLNNKIILGLKKGFIVERDKLYQDETGFIYHEASFDYTSAYWAKEATSLYQVKLQALPTFYFPNKNGDKNFNIGIGGQLGLLAFRYTKGKYYVSDITGQSIYVGINNIPYYGQVSKNKLLIPLNTGFTLTTGYKWINLFYKKEWGAGAYIENKNKTYPLFSPSQRSKDYTYSTIGLRFGI